MSAILFIIFSHQAASAPDGCGTPPYSPWLLELRLGLNICFALLAWTLAFLSLARPGKSAACPHYVHGLRLWLSWGYLTALLRVASIGCLWCHSTHDPVKCKYIGAAHKAAVVFGYCGMIMLLRMRVMELEAAQGTRKWGRRMTRCVIWPTLPVLSVMVVLNSVMVALPSCSCHKQVQWLSVIVAAWLGLSQTTCVAMTLHAFGLALKLAKADASTWAGGLRDARMGTVAWTQKQLWLLVLCCATSVVYISLFVALQLSNIHYANQTNHVHLEGELVSFHTPVLLVLCDVAEVVDTITNGICFLFLSGLLEGRLRLLRLRKGTGWSSQATIQRVPSCQKLSRAWDSKVQELSRRGVTVEKLLDFYATLGRACMAHWDPKRHTTAHVVRQAIIPASKCSEFGPCAMATILHEGKSVPARRMVTHAWDSLWADLVNTVVADALGLPTYQGLAAWLLPSRIETLKSHLRRVGTLHRAYWICALSVNQHSCICAGGAVTLDPVLGCVEPRCDCGFAKWWNDTPPLSEHGQSCPCEINKFDDMMVLLAREDPDFTQLVAVDHQLLVFQRAWCMAEIFVAHACTMRQVAVMHSERELDEHRPEFENLRVEDMQASREEDKQMILARVGDPTAFNETLREIVLDRTSGLFGTWWDAIGTARRLGCMAKRHHTGPG